MERSDNIKQKITGTLTEICIGSGTLLVGLTGGIATGKSTVAEMFYDLGGVIIDFDLLARNIVEPGRKSWHLIIDFFGNDIVNHDSTINRKKLSGIVFNDPSKREKLESFTHPFIWDEFILKVKKSIRQNKDSIIFAVIPLLIEGNMQQILKKILLFICHPTNRLKG